MMEKSSVYAYGIGNVLYVFSDMLTAYKELEGSEYKFLGNFKDFDKAVEYYRNSNDFIEIQIINKITE